MTQEEKESIVEELKEYIQEHLNIDVDGYYEAYSGQREHYHRVTISFD
ncbi:MAG: hypothetical protein IJ640_07965 [Prevotella sp.]|nr:hypothetical protein [Prevotella sp.]